MYMVLVPTPSQSLMLCLFPYRTFSSFSTQIHIPVFQDPVSSTLPLLRYSAPMLCTTGVSQGLWDYVLVVDAKGVEQFCACRRHSSPCWVKEAHVMETCSCSYCFPLLHSPWPLSLEDNSSSHSIRPLRGQQHVRGKEPQALQKTDPEPTASWSWLHH